MDILGWDILPEKCEIEFRFEDGPGWLKLLALMPVFEKFAYPIAIRRHIAYLWSTSFSQEQCVELESEGWIVYSREKTKTEKFLEGSLAIMSQSSSRVVRRRPKISVTRWGHVRATRKWVHKSNGTYTHFKNRTTPVEL